MSEQVTVTVWATDGADAIAKAKDWAKAEPRLRLRTITRVAAERPDLVYPAGMEHRWSVTLAVTWQEATA